MAIGVAARAGKHRPIGIAPHVGGLPARLVAVVKSLRYVLIRRFTVEHWLYWFVLPGRVNVHPVVLLGIVGYGVFLVAHTLAVTAVTALEHVEV